MIAAVFAIVLYYLQYSTCFLVESGIDMSCAKVSCHRLNLSSKNVPNDIATGFIIGNGRIGEMVPSSSSGPIYIATRNNDLQDIITNTPVNRREDLVFLQNGILTSFLEKNKVDGCTQGLIYFAVSKKGEKPIDGVTALNPEGLTAITGKWANDFASRLNAAGLSCHVLEKNAWTLAMLEKHIWICAYMAVGAKHKCTVGEVETQHTDEVRNLINELVSAASHETGLKFSAGVAERLGAYAVSVAHFPTALKEFEVGATHGALNHRFVLSMHCSGGTVGSWTSRSGPRRRRCRILVPSTHRLLMKHGNNFRNNYL